jgi:hypothetical protein
MRRKRVSERGGKGEFKLYDIPSYDYKIGDRLLAEEASASVRSYAKILLPRR